MQFSDWQLNRLRDALRAYHDYGRDAVDGRFYNWKDVSEAISLCADIEVPPERLRQFVEGNRSKDGARRKFQSMQEASLEAIVKFLTEERLLLPAELEERAPEAHAAQRLLEYLDQEFDTIRLLPLAIFEGTYQMRQKDDRRFAIREVTLQQPSGEGMMRVTMTEDYYLKDAEEQYDGWTPEQRRQYRRNRTLYGGWAIFTPEENVLVFLKEADNGKNLYQFTLAAEVANQPGAAIERLILLRHVYPVELENTNRDEEAMLSAILKDTEKNILILRRIV
jgi:hypothetical protein